MVSLVLIYVCRSIEQAIVSLKLCLVYVGTTKIRAQIKNINRLFIFLNREKHRWDFRWIQQFKQWINFETSFYCLKNLLSPPLPTDYALEGPLFKNLLKLTQLIVTDPKAYRVGRCICVTWVFAAGEDGFSMLRDWPLKTYMWYWWVTKLGWPKNWANPD